MQKLKAAIKSQPTIYKYARRVHFALKPPHEKEVGLLPFLVDPARLAVDVGANVGTYVYALLKLRAPVLAIEPIPRLAADLQRLFEGKARVVAAAASSSAGTARLRIPRVAMQTGMATIESENTLDETAVDEINVPKVVLDEMDLGPVGFIKIDVEGHEYEVLRGARNLLQRDRPTILVEAEDRHRPGAVASIRDLLAPLGYHGLMLDDGRLSSIANFDPRRDQTVPAEHREQLNAGGYRGRYINNFLFVT